MIVDQYSRWISLVGMKSYSSDSAIQAISKWARGEKGLTTLNSIEYIRSDSGTQFRSEQFQKFCGHQFIECELAAPEHQEMNSICEANWKRVKETSKRMLINASLSHHFRHLPYFYSIAILNVMPTRGLSKAHNKVTTPYELVKDYKPSLNKFHTFGYPVVFKRNTLTTKTKGPTAAMQLGMKATFIGFPSNQAGYLLYLEKPIQGHGHYMISKDVSFDDNLDSALVTNKYVFKGGLNVISIGKGHVESLVDREEESTGNVAHLQPQSLTDVINNNHAVQYQILKIENLPVMIRTQKIINLKHSKTRQKKMRPEKQLKRCHHQILRDMMKTYRQQISTSMTMSRPLQQLMSTL
jgi:hypothetical protein